MNLALSTAILKTRLALLKGDWDEEKHPRAEDGKWTDGDKDSLQLMHGTTYQSAQQIIKEGLKPGEGVYVYATPDKSIAIEYGWSR